MDLCDGRREWDLSQDTASQPGEARRGGAVSGDQAEDDEAVNPASTAWVIAMADEPRSFPNFNRVIVSSLVLSYINSLALGLAFNLGALGDIPLLVQPKNSIDGHGLRALPPLILLIPLPGFLGMTKARAKMIHYPLNATIRSQGGPFCCTS